MSAFHGFVQVEGLQCNSIGFLSLHYKLGSLMLLLCKTMVNSLFVVSVEPVDICCIESAGKVNW